MFWQTWQVSIHNWQVSYGLLRAAAIRDSVQHMNESHQKTLANKFCHNPDTRDKYYYYLCTNQLACTAVEGMRSAAAAASKVSFYALHFSNHDLNTIVRLSGRKPRLYVSQRNAGILKCDLLTTYLSFLIKISK